jgi:hypothetical protein
MSDKPEDRRDFREVDVIPNGDRATMYHAGTGRYYRVRVMSVMTPEEVNNEMTVNGLFPLNKQDEGPLMTKMSEENGCVRIDYNKPVAWLAMTGDEAMEFAQGLMHWARKVGLTKPFTIKL